MKNTSGARKGRPGSSAVRQGSKGKQVGSGGQGRQALEGKKPTPAAEDRPYHPAGKAKAARERLEAARGRGGAGPRAGSPIAGRGGPDAPRRRPKSADDHEMVTGRNSVVEALRTRIPATTLYIAARIEMDERTKEILQLATRRGLPILEVMRPELDRITGHDSVHQGVALKVPPYEYAHPVDMLEAAVKRQQKPLFVALDGITDPRNLGAIIRSVAAFGGQGVIVPQRRSVGLTASAWKTSAGAAARIPVAMASNLTQTLKSFKEQGVFVVGLDGDGDVMLPGLELADRPIVVVVGSEGKGLSRIVAETCDAIVSVPITGAVESLNAGIAASVTLYEISKLRAERKKK
ncbi:MULTISPECIES: 23S rRNA (guanosine(2251)-2'-O)-methyltransferase RlmB [Frigoribacterium]|uniref:23S rRNA (guanosine(2251)-2'-O)-methyltransferase RlmB n=1 Tax=Frigoribacterium TaxID=96492 RepID=UPI0006F1D835|nr:MULTISPECIES: 23S rRNA (guanosine(2251)-2'-O)-methyltransferase RlmB [Frigoribacterium]MBD8484628.1 23S rRNA (guanosine(2251)-2'-O)-methyltransferase RlmB [Frigoribacterium sp. CFBP 8759]NQW88086.1 23S rRNA (guanosine(2251)-2'-O)-methyltransferase RlmB [Frigoribacterium sp. VKM Ac-2860]NQX09105.1 23S rRNA (guanosine(2251)-2'-O)-methyltransferase RlmB [Frigoribacterium sp. VKM Ac-2859]KQM29223.1 RNA methyltransferase [Frigoribacterium sp. Leaf8]ROS51234.1 23S rRNA (guanosine2251-2'-O)-methyl